MSKYPGRIVTDLAPAGYSVFFDGTGDFLTLPNVTALTLGTGDFTLEGWFYAPNLPGAGAYRQIVDLRAGNFNNAGLNVDLFGSTLEFTIGANVAGTATVVANQWYHFALVRSGTTYSSYLNGSRVATGSNSTNLTGFEGYIGSYNSSGTNVFFGYISNVRILKGTALYSGATINVPTQLLNITNTSLLTCNSPAIVDQSSNSITITINGNTAVSTFTPFTAYVPYNPALGASTPGVWTVDEAMQAAATRQWNMYDPQFPQTTLLLHGNPTNGTSFITDASTNNFTLTPNGDVRAANLSPFSLTTFATSGSGYFDGNADYLTLTQSVFAVGTGNYTLEAWVYLTAAPGTEAGIISSFNTGGGQGFYLAINSSRQPFFAVGNGATSNPTVTGTAIPLNTWTHIAGVRSSGTLTLYVNGTSVGTPTSATASIDRTLLGIGLAYPNSPQGYLTGYISNARVTTIAVYTGNFTTPTTPLTATQAAGTNISAITGTQTSLLTLQNSQSANNNAFLDSSSNNFLITRNGNTTQGSFSPFSQTGWSNFFPTSDNYFGIAGNAAFSFTGDFTVECFVYQIARSDNGVVTEISSYLDGVMIRLGTISSIYDTVYVNGVNVASVSQFVTLNTWTHIAVVRSGTTVTVYVNGISRGTATVSGTVNTTSGAIRVAAPLHTTPGTQPFQGYISNLRILKGTAQYTTGFTPPTVPFTNITNTSLLTCQSNRFVDNSTNNSTITITGTPSVQPFSPFYPTAAYTPQTIGGSGYFDGTTDWLSIANNAAFDLGTGDCTVECWLYRATSGTLQGIVTAFPSGGTPINGWGLYINTSNFVYMDSWVGNVEQTFTASDNAIPVNAWTHIAYTRQSGTSRLFVNGRLCTATGPLTQAINTGGFELQIGRSNYGATNYVTGYISNLRIVKGTAVYTAAFTPATAPLTAITNTSLLTNFTNAGVVDSTAKNALETVGDAKISTAVSRFGGSSMFFDGTGDSLLFPSSPIRALGTADFTIEFWFNASSIPTFAAIIDMRDPNTDNAGFDIMFYFNKVAFGTATIAYITGVSTLSTGTWYHYALTRSGNTFRQFLNGVQEGSTYNGSTTQNFTNTILRIANGANGPYTGYLDDIRITRGFARYTANFTPQTSQWQDQ